MSYAYILTAALSAALSFGGAWKIQNWRYGAKETERAEQQITMERELRALDNKRASGVIAAQNTARVRDVALRRGADLARTELDGLRAQSADALLAGSNSLDACIVGATAFSGLLGQCSGRYTELAGKASRHASDVQTCQAAYSAARDAVN
jgi:hypothetical protein